jgi:hypothetical protein
MESNYLVLLDPMNGLMWNICHQGTMRMAFVFFFFWSCTSIWHCLIKLEFNGLIQSWWCKGKFPWQQFFIPKLYIYIYTHTLFLFLGFASLEMLQNYCQAIKILGWRRRLLIEPIEKKIFFTAPLFTRSLSSSRRRS